MNLEQWPCLVSDPDVFNTYVQKISAARVLTAPHEHEFVDVFSLDPADLFGEPVAFIFLIELSEAIQKRYADITAAIGPSDIPRFERDIEHLKALKVRLIHQRIVNACAVVAIAHCFANIPGCEFSGITGWDPESNRKAFESHEALRNALKETVSEFELSTSCEDDVMTHYIALVPIGGGLWELDGRQEFPIYHGPVDGGKWAVKALAVMKAITGYDPENSKYNIMALQRK